MATSSFDDRYRLHQLIGSSADAAGYVADDLTLNRRVAVKVFANQLAATDGFGERFETACAAASALSHPNLLEVYDWGRTPVCYLVTELAVGGSLRAMLDTGERLSQAQALVVGLEAARALEHVHSAGLAHGGVRPSNLLFDSDARLRLADTGLAAAMAAGGREAPAGYAPPEQGSSGDSSGSDSFGGDSSGDDSSGGDPSGDDLFGEQAADLYSLAVTLREAITGEAPDGLSTPEADAPDSALSPLWYAVGPATAPDPQDRPSAAEFAADLLAMAELLSRPEPLRLATTPAGGHERSAAGRAGGASPAPARHRRQPGASRLSEPPPGWSGDRPREAHAHAPSGASLAEASPIPLDDPPRRRWPGLLLAVVLVLVSACGGVWLWRNSMADPLLVPDLLGASRVAAAAAAVENGWQVEEILVRVPDTEPGEVVRTEPAAGEALNDASTLTLFTSLGEPLVRVPDVYALTVSDAEASAGELGLVVVGQTPVSDVRIPEGFVVGVDVPGGVYELEAGEEIRLLVSSGPADQIVPLVPSGRMLDTAEQVLLFAGLLPSRAQDFSREVAEGEVIGFDPPSGTPVPPGSVVTVVVSQGPSQIEIPNVIGMDAESAVELLEQLGFAVTRDGSDGPLVASTDPPPGEFVALGAAVVISSEE